LHCTFFSLSAREEKPHHNSKRVNTSLFCALKSSISTIQQKSAGQTGTFTHSDVRAPIISGIVKIRALGKSFFKQLHNQSASPEAWAKAREILDHWEGFLANANKPDKVGSSFLLQLKC